MNTSTSTPAFLPPVEKPKGAFLKLVYYLTRKKFGKVMTPLSVFSARMPTSFSLFYGKVSRLDKKLRLPSDMVPLLRGRVSSVNGCLFCTDAARAFSLDNSIEAVAKFDALEEYRTNPLFTEAERAALDYATELTANKVVTDDTFTELSRHYSDREICDIVWLVASEHLYNLSNIGLNIGSDGLCQISATKRRAKGLS